MPGVDPGLYRQLETLPETQVGEILGGEVFASPRPASPHVNVIFELGGLLRGPFRHGLGGPGGWWIFPEPEVHLGAEVLVPDLAGWRRERLPETPRVAAFTVAPDWVCEVLSPRSARRDQVIKRAIYGENKVSFLWFIDPVRHVLEVLTLTDEGWLVDAIFTDDDEARAKPFDAVALPLATLWMA